MPAVGDAHQRRTDLSAAGAEKLSQLGTRHRKEYTAEGGRLAASLAHRDRVKVEP